MQLHRLEQCEDGFSLVEVLVAMCVIVVLVTSLSQLFAMATLSNVGDAGCEPRHRSSRRRRLEELRALAFGFDSGGSLDQSVCGLQRLSGLVWPANGSRSSRLRQAMVDSALGSDATNGIVLSVAVLPRRAMGQGSTGPDVVRLVTARTRKVR
jgi:prepilin-type N-terminal cleavage/methylation domain-containing protein